MDKYNYQYSLDEKRWIKSTNFAKSVGRIHKILKINNTSYVVGHKGISTLNDEYYKFRSNKQYNRCATCPVGNKILVICKDCNDSDLECSLFNPINKQWSDANIEIKRTSYAVVDYLNKVWIIGGCERDDYRGLKPLNTVEVYDPVNKNQILVPIKLNEARYCHKVIIYKKKLFVFGGFGKDGYLNSVELFSPGTNKFVMMASMKIAREDFACCRVGNLVYVIGGLIRVGGLFDETNSVEIYNLDNNTWTEGVGFPVSECALHACAVNDKL